jgi:mannose-6-phosphate isomerase
MAPIRLTPRLLEKVWGATTLEPWFRNQPEKTGEVWFEGVPDLPLLVKLLFTSEKLSVQVHPDDAAARLHLGSRGKTPLGKAEMWHVLRAEPGAKIAAGFRREISEQDLRESALSGEIMNLLEWHEARVGDTFFIPAGTVHAIGEGLVLCEIQQNSDVTYRLYDYGRPRELHLDDAVRVSRRTPYDARVTPGDQWPEGQASQARTLVTCEYFTTEKIQLVGSLRRTLAPGRLEWWIVLEGAAEMAGQATRAGEVWYLGAGQAPVNIHGDAVLLRTSAPV